MKTASTSSDDSTARLVDIMGGLAKDGPNRDISEVIFSANADVESVLLMLLDRKENLC